MIALTNSLADAFGAARSGTGLDTAGDSTAPAHEVAASLQTLHVIASINQQIGGPAVTVPRLASALSATGVGCVVASLDDKRFGPVLQPPGVTLFNPPADGMARRLRGYSPAFRRALMARAKTGVDVVHNHGAWMLPNLYARQSALSAQVPLVISPRGMLESWSLARSRAKKMLAWRLYERRNFDSAALFHATSQAEADSIRALGLRQPIAMISNGVDLPEPGSVPPRDVLEHKFPRLAGRRWLLFLSRLHPKKGVDELLQAWVTLAVRFPDWQLVIAGPDLDGHGAALRSEAAARGLGDRVVFTGMLAGREKACALAGADLFVLPTRSENFGVVVAESLAYGVPVVTTRAAPWSELLSHECGWWIEADPGALGNALGVAMALPAFQLAEMGRRGRALVESRYAWARIGAEMKSVYLWLCRQGDQPACVQTP